MPNFNIGSSFDTQRIQNGFRKIKDSATDFGRRLTSNKRQADQLAASMTKLTAAKAQVGQVFGTGRGGRFAGGASTSFGIGGTGQTFGSLAQAQNMRNMIVQQQALTKAQDDQVKSSKKQTQQNRRQGVSFGQLLGLMVKFGIAMQLITIPEKIISGIAAFVSGGTKMEASLANVNSLLRVNRNEINELGRALRFTIIEQGAQGDLFAAAFEAASTLDRTTLSRIRTLTGGIRLANEELQTTFDLVRLSSELAVAGATDVEVAMRAVTAVISGFGLQVHEAEKFADTMFATVDFGRVSFEKLASSVGDFIGIVNRLAGDDPVKQFEQFNEVMAAFGTITKTLEPAEAATSLRNLAKSLTNNSAEGEKLIRILKGLGVNLNIQDVLTMGFAGSIEELNRGLGKNGIAVNKLAEIHGEFGSIQEENLFRQAKQLELFQILNPNIRSQRGIDALFVNNLESFRQNLDKTNTSLGESSEAFKIQKDTVQSAMTSFKGLFSLLRDMLFGSVAPGLQRFIRSLSEGLQEALSDEAFAGLGFATKLRVVWDALLTSFDIWLDHGGREQLEKTATVLSEILSNFLVKALTLPAVNDAFSQVGFAIGKGLLRGIVVGTFSGNPINQNIKALQRQNTESQADVISPSDSNRSIGGLISSNLFLNQIKFLSGRARPLFLSTNSSDNIIADPSGSNTPQVNVENLNITTSTDQMSEEIQKAIRDLVENATGGQVQKPSTTLQSNRNPQPTIVPTFNRSPLGS